MSGAASATAMSASIQHSSFWYGTDFVLYCVSRQRSGTSVGDVCIMYLYYLASEPMVMCLMSYSVDADERAELAMALAWSMSVSLNLI